MDRITDMAATLAAWRETHPLTEDSLEHQRALKREHARKRRKNGRDAAYRKQKYQDDVCYRIAEVLRSRLRQALKDGWRSGSAVGDLGCTIAELKEYLESQFRDGMSWENYGVVWEIDHVKPLSSFDLTQQDQTAQACHYTNLQPLLLAENRSKHDKT